MIYRDFNHWFSTSEVHGFSSASREFAKELWDDLEPTMQAKLDDHMRAHVELAKEQAVRNSKLVTAMLEYIEAHKQEGQRGFWRWWFDQVKNKS